MCTSFFPLQLLIAVHGTEGALAAFLRPGSIYIEIDNAADRHKTFYYQHLTLIAGIKYFYFGGVYPSIEECNDWLAAMSWAKGCGIYVDLTKFNELLKLITGYVADCIAGL
jgi:hypothetical protein